MYWIFKFRCYCYKAADAGTLCEIMCVCVWGFLFCGFIFHCSQGVSGIDVRYYKMGIIFNFFYFVSRVFLFLLVAYVFCKQYCIFVWSTFHFLNFNYLIHIKKEKKTLNEVKFTKRPETLQIKNNDIYFIALKKKTKKILI